MPKRVWVAIGFSLIGIALLASQSFELGRQSVLGDGLAALAAISAAATFCLARKARATSMVPAMAAAGLLYGLIALPFAAPLDVTPADWLWLALMGLVSVPLGFSLLTLAPRYLPAPEVSLMMLLEAVLGPLLVWLVLSEFPGVRGLLGGGLVVIALLGMHLAERRESS